MPICNNRQCKLRGVEQDDAKFEGRKGVCKQCADCRSREMERKTAASYQWPHRSQRSVGGAMAVRGVVDTLIPGPPPQFLSEAHKTIHRGWLLSLINGGNEMNKTQASIINHLQKRGPATMLDLQRVSGVTLSATNSAIEALLAQGYIERCAVGQAGGVKMKESDYAAA